MREFFRSRAGKQFLICCGWAAVLWVTAVQYRAEIFLFLGAVSGDKTGIAIITANVAGLVSFIYSILRILDLRDEMVRRREAELRADHIATHDHLTKLPNRYAFDRLRLDDILSGEEGGSTVTVYSIDLDGFKKVNDLLGHQGGDALLTEISKRISAFADRGSVFRFGGDEFIAVARNLPPEKEERFAQLLIQSITRPVRIGRLTAEVGASIGYARLPEHGVTLEEVSHVSDIALYEAKSKGPNNCVLFHPDMKTKVNRRAKLDGELRQAIETEQITPFYQPLVNLRTGRIFGFEALARWKRSNGEHIAPDVFIAVAEETGLITPLFERLLRRACQDAMRWPDHMVLSFNVYPEQMEDRLLAARNLNILKETALAPERLEIEITENALIEDPDLAASTMESLHEAGIQIALDDFGTGYSNLSQLARFKFDKIKIDKSFVANCTTDERQEKIIQAMLGLSRSLHVKTTVEGVEDNRQLAYFLSHGCDIGQGYLFGKAMPAGEVHRFLAANEQVLGMA